MLSRTLDPVTRANLQALVDANFTQRDELYEAAECLDDEDRRQVCQRLADHLAGHAIHLQQVLAQMGAGVPEPPASTDKQAQFRRAREVGGANAVLEIVERCEHSLNDVYARAIQATPDSEAVGIIEAQHRNVDFGERVLRSLRRDEGSAHPRRIAQSVRSTSRKRERGRPA
ncbi:MAG: hypothetical protein KDA60_00320 [Planctomycetales bacterium]|nr:hypothetical protein [Planctomycetales bacterium]